MEGKQLTGVLIVGSGAIAILYFFGKKQNALTAPGAQRGITGSLASLLSPGQGGPATVNAGGRTIAAAPRPTGIGGNALPSTVASGGTSGSWPNIVASAGALLAGIGRVVTPGPSQAPAAPVNNTPVFTIGQTQGLANLSALTARTQDELSQISTYDAYPNTLVDPGYGSSSPDISAMVTGLDSTSLPSFDFGSSDSSDYSDFFS